MRNKNNIRKNSASYQDWLYNHDGFDNESLEKLCEPSPIPLSPYLEDLYEVLETLYYEGKFKPRHKQIIKLLMKGFTSPQDIAKRLNIKCNTVSTLLRQIGKKVLKNVDKYVV